MRNDALLFGKKKKKDDPSDKVVSLRVLLVHSVNGREKFCDRGDSGSGVFVTDVQADGRRLSGLMVSMVKVNAVSQIFGAMVPQSQVLRALEKKTHMSWHLVCSPVLD